MKIGDKLFVYNKKVFPNIYTVVDTDPLYIEQGIVTEWDGEDGKLTVSKKRGSKVCKFNIYDIGKKYITIDEYIKRANDISFNIANNSEKAKKLM